MAFNVGSLVATLTADNKQFDKILDNAVGKVSSTVSRINALGGKLAGFGTKATLMVSTPLLALNAFLVQVGGRSQHTRRQFEQVFQGITTEAQSMAEHLNESFGMSGGEARKLLSTTGNLLQNLGFTRDEALDMSFSVQKLSADLAAFHGAGMSATDANNSLNLALLGSGQGLRALGFAIDESDAEFKELVKTLERGEGRTKGQAEALATLKLMLERNSNVLGASARESETYVAQQAELLNDIKDLASSFGSILIPQATKWVKRMREIVQWLNNLDDSTKLVIVQTGRWLIMIGPLVFFLGRAIQMIGLTVFAVQNIGTAFAAAGKGIMLAIGALKVLAVVIGGIILDFGLIPLAGVAIGITLAAVAIYKLAQRIIGESGLIGAFIKLKGMVKSVWDFIKLFMSNWQENSKILFKWLVTNAGIAFEWLQQNWFNLVKDAIQLWWLWTKSIPRNFMIGLELMFRLVTAFGGWMRAKLQALWDWVWGGGLYMAMLEGWTRAFMIVMEFGKAVTAVFMSLLVSLAVVMMKIAPTLRELFMSIISGGATTAMVAAVVKLGKELQPAFESAAQRARIGFLNATEQFVSDAEGGAEDLGGTMNKIFNEQIGKIENPFKEFKSSIEEAPKFTKLALKGVNEEVAKAVPKGDLDKLFGDRTVTIDFKIQGLSATEVGSFEDRLLLMQSRAYEIGKAIEKASPPTTSETSALPKLAETNPFFAGVSAFGTSFREGVVSRVQGISSSVGEGVLTAKNTASGVGAALSAKGKVEELLERIAGNTDKKQAGEEEVSFSFANLFGR